MDPSIPAEVVLDWLVPCGVVAAVPVPPGMSGARVYRCSTADRNCLALKRWPVGVTLARIDEIHQLMRLARSHDCPLVPDIVAPQSRVGKSAALRAAGYCWDLVDWMPGEPIEADTAIEKISAGVAAIARFHLSTRHLGRRAQVAPAVVDRMLRLRQLSDRIGSLVELSDSAALNSPLEDAVRRAAQLLGTHWNQVRTQIGQSLAAHMDRPVLTQYVLRDVHRQHILFSEDRPSGLIDFDAARIDTPAVDLARWAGSFLAGPHEQAAVWQAVAAGLVRESPLLPSELVDQQIALAKLIAQASPWISLANWLVWILVEKRQFPPGSAAVAQRVSFLTKSAVQVIRAG